MKKVPYTALPPKEMYTAIYSLIKSHTDSYDNAEITEDQIKAEFRAQSPRYPPGRPIPEHWIRQTITAFRKNGWRISLYFKDGARVYCIGRS